MIYGVYEGGSEVGTGEGGEEDVVVVESDRSTVASCETRSRRSEGWRASSAATSPSRLAMSIITAALAGLWR